MGSEICLLDKEQKNKKIDEAEYELIVRIFEATGIEDPIRYPYVANRYYNAIFSINPENEYETGVVGGYPNPRWNRRFRIPFEPGVEFLNLEIVRYFAWSEPASSNGVVLVGRAKIPLPSEINTQKKGWAELIRFTQGRYVPEGNIRIATALAEVELDYYYPDTDC